MIPLAALQDRRMTYRQLVVLGALCSFRNGAEEWEIHPTREAIAQRCGLHPSVISSATSDLMQLGWLVKDGKGGFSKATRYTITVPETVTQSVTVAEPVTVAETATRSPSALRNTQRVADSVTRIEERDHSEESDPRSSKASRLPADWSVPNQYRDWSIANLGWTVDQVEVVAERFADYWHAATKNAAKADWFATWRNWCRRERVMPAGAQSSFSVFEGAI